MEPTPVHIAVLVIAEDAAAADLATAEAVAERATAAGHVIFARAVVPDDEEAIRSQLDHWIGEPDIDVVIASGGAESEAIAGALEPLITERLPGFTDLFRWLAFQELGAGAMQSNAEAVQCSTTFVFVLPASLGAVGAAMDKLILPQLDPRTKPKNLVSQLPRLLAKADATRPDVNAGPDAVPVVISSEKTVAGSGVAPKLPAVPAPGKSAPNVVPRKQGEAPTKVIELARLQRELQASSESPHDAVTKPFDLARLLPKVPPGADESLDPDEESPLFMSPAPKGRGPAIARATPALGRPAQPAAPVARITPVPARVGPAPPTPAPIVPTRIVPADPPTQDGPTKVARAPEPPTKVMPVMAAAIAQDGPTKVAPVPEPPTKVMPVPTILPRSRATPIAGTPAVAEPQAPARVPDKTATPAAGLPRVPDKTATPAVGLPRVPDKTATPAAGLPRVPDKTATPAAGLPRVPDKTATPAVGLPRVATPPPAPTRPAPPADHTIPDDDAITGDVIALRRSDAITPITDEVVTEEQEQPPNVSAPAIELPSDAVISETDDKPAADVDDDEEATRRQREVGTVVGPPPPPPAPARPIVATPPPAPVARPRSHDPTMPVRRSDGDDLPQGEFVYPVKRRSKAKVVVVVLLVLAAGAAGGVFAVQRFVLDAHEPAVATPTLPPPPPAPPPTPAPVVEIDAAEVATAPPIDASEDIEVDTPDAQIAAVRPDAAVRPVRPVAHPPPPHPAHPGVAGAPHETPHDTPPPPPPPPPQPTEDGCDEVSCVMDHYARACCAKFKPAESDFKPSVGTPAELDKTMVRTGIEKVKPKVISCGEKFSAKGTVKVSLSVGGDGNVKDASVVESPDPSLGDCVATALKKAHFTKTTNGATFTYPFVF